MHAHMCAHTHRRFDQDGDNKVDLMNFLNFFLSRDNHDKRTSVRVTHACEALRTWILSMQVPKLKAQNSDHVDRCVCAYM